MDQNQDFTVQKKSLEKQIASALLDALGKGEIAKESLRPVAQEILTEFEKATNSNEISTFINTISAKWPFFKGLSLQQKGEEIKQKEAQVIEKLSNYIKDTN